MTSYLHLQLPGMLAETDMSSLTLSLYALLAGLILVLLTMLPKLLGIRYIPNSKIGIIEKLWSARGSLKQGQIVARNGEAGMQAHILRGGMHFGFYPWIYRIHKMGLVSISEGKIGYVYARDGVTLEPSRTLGRVVECQNFQDGDGFLNQGGQRGRQRMILREGTWAINTALFVVITEERVHSGPINDADVDYRQWQQQLAALDGFNPVVIGSSRNNSDSENDSLAGHRTDTPSPLMVELKPWDNLGVVSVHDGPPLESGAIIAPEVKAIGTDGHNNFQDPEIFLSLHGKRGKQLQVLTDGTYFLNRWFATVDRQPKLLIPIGYVGVVVSYYGGEGADTTGKSFRYGEQVDRGCRGVWKEALPPGKYALNPYALKVEPVPTINFVLRWITGQSEAHRYDEGLSSVALVTADGYEPVLPLSLVLHIDYQKAPSVVQRFGDVKRLITQTLDPILTAYFRDVAQSANMLDLLTKREEIQTRATDELGRRFQDYDINCISVLIGRPESKPGMAAGASDPIDRLFDQLRLRRLAEEQKETFAKQTEAAQHQQKFNEAQAAAAKQAELTETLIGVQLAANRGDATLAMAQRDAKKDIALAEGASRAAEVRGKGEAAAISQVGMAEAAVSLQKITAFGNPRLYALKLIAEEFAKSNQPLVPERLLIMGEGKDGGTDAQGSASGVLGQFLTLLVSEKAGVDIAGDNPALEALRKHAAELTVQAEEAKL